MSTRCKQSGRNLRHRIKIESAADRTDGTLTPTYTTLVNGLPAEVLGMAGRESRHGLTMDAVYDHLITIRYRSDITPKMRLIWETRTLNIVSAVDREGDRRWLTITAKEDP